MAGLPQRLIYGTFLPRVALPSACFLLHHLDRPVLVHLMAPPAVGRGSAKGALHQQCVTDVLVPIRALFLAPAGIVERFADGPATAVEPGRFPVAPVVCSAERYASLIFAAFALAFGFFALTFAFAFAFATTCVGYDLAVFIVPCGAVALLDKHVCVVVPQGRVDGNGFLERHPQGIFLSPRVNAMALVLKASSTAMKYWMTERSW